MNSEMSDEEKQYRNIQSLLSLNKSKQRIMIEHNPILKEFIDLQLEEKTLSDELQELSSKVENKNFHRCNHIWIKSFYSTPYGDKKNMYCLKCGYGLRKYDDSKGQIFTDIECDYKIAREAYLSIISDNLEIDDETLVKLLKEKLNHGPVLERKNR